MNVKTYTLRQDVHSHSTRNKYAFNLLPLRLQKTDSSHLCMKIKPFNKLQNKTFLVDIKYLKLVLSNWLKTKACYSVNIYTASDVSSISCF